jgi:hypothetical protein
MFTIKPKTAQKHICAALLQRGKTEILQRYDPQAKTLNGIAFSVVDTQQRIQSADCCN